MMNGDDKGHYTLQFQFLLAEGADAEGIQSELNRRLSELEGIEHLRVGKSEPRFDLATVASAIGVGVVVIKGATEAVESLRRLVKAVKALVAELDGVSSAQLDVGDEVRDVREVGEEELGAATEAARM